MSLIDDIEKLEKTLPKELEIDRVEYETSTLITIHIQSKYKYPEKFSGSDTPLHFGRSISVMQKDWDDFIKKGWLNYRRRFDSMWEHFKSQVYIEKRIERKVKNEN